MAERCTHTEPGLGRCWDDTGFTHGHHFRPYKPEPALALSEPEARELIAYMRPQYLDPNRWPVMSAMLDRLERVTR